MREATIVLALLIAQCSGKTCVVYDGEGKLLDSRPHALGTIGRDTKPGSVLPGELRFENVRPVSVKTGNCDVEVVVDGNRMRFISKREFRDEDECTFTVSVRSDGGCPVTVPNEYTLRYHIQDGGKFHGFVRESYSIEATFPVAKGAKLSDVDIEVSSFGVWTRVELEEDFDGLEIVPIGSSLDPRIGRFEMRATRLLYLLEDLNLTMIATDGVLSSKARLTIRMNENSAMPRPEFEKSYYVARVNASDLDFNMDVYPAGIITLKDDYRRVSFDLRPLNDNDLEFSLRNESTRTVAVLLAEETPKNVSSQDVILQLTARISDRFGRESEGFTTLLIQVEGIRKCSVMESPVLYEWDNTEHLTIAVIVLSVVIIVLLLVIIFLYFKYVCVKKPKPPAPCKKCLASPTVKTRRPTPRKISEFPYPLDVMPPPLETLAETDVEEEGGETKCLEITVTTPKEVVPPVPSTSGEKTRKRSMTFRESDEEARQYREGTPVAEVVVHEAKRKASNESQRSQRRMSIEEERRRRRSSVKMYRCLS